MTISDRLVVAATNAFPRRWRETHGEELLEAHAELSSGSATAREVVELVAGGIRVRLADRPPTGMWLRYVGLGRPVEPRWHGWMHDQLTSRWFRFTNTVPWSIYFATILMGPGLLWGPEQLTFPAASVVAIVVVSILMSPIKQRKLQKQVSAKIGYDITTDAWRVMAPATSTPANKWLQPSPTTRYAIDLYGRPVGTWASLGGLSLIVGAAWPSDRPTTALGASFTPDPNSPMGSSDVWLALTGTLAATAVLVATWRHFLVRRAERLPTTSVHPLAGSASQRTFWAITTLPGIAGVGLGLSGAPPDLACVSIGAVLLVGGSVVLTADYVARRHGRRLGRDLSMADLLVGECPPALAFVPPPPGPDDARTRT